MKRGVWFVFISPASRLRLLYISLSSGCEVKRQFGKVCQSFKASLYCPSQHARLITF